MASNEVVKEILKKIENIYGKDREVIKIDGINIDFDDWRFNLRSSQTEPYIRLNVETRGNKALLKEKTDELLDIIRSQG